MPAPELDIVIPVYNEGKNIVATLRAIDREVRTRARVLLIYDRPDDNTFAAVEAHRGEFADLTIEFLANKSRGAHAAVMTGFSASKAPHVLMFPADDDYNACILDTMLARAKDVEAATAVALVVAEVVFLPVAILVWHVHRAAIPSRKSRSASPVLPRAAP